MRFFILLLSVLLVFSCDPPAPKDIYDPSNESSAADISEYTLNPGKTSGNTDVDDYYDYWLGNFVKKSRYFDSNGALYVAADANGYIPPAWGDVADKSQSEAHGYGMLISAIMKDKAIFDGLYKMYKLYPSTIDSDLMSWIIPENEDTSLRDTAATDGDFDIAYALIMAHENFTSDPVNGIDYLGEARRIINNGIKTSLIDSTTKRIKRGDWQSDSLLSRSSDWMPGHMRVFDAYNNVNDSDYWNAVISEIYQCIAEVADSNTGLVPDFIGGVTARPVIVGTSEELEGVTDDDYSYNACRFPWRIATDYLHYGTDNAKVAVSKILDWFGSTNSITNFKAGYTLSGTVIGDYQSAAFISPIAVAAMVDSKYNSILADGKTYMKSQKYNYYYEETITMLCMLMAHNVWQAPDGTP